MFKKNVGIDISFIILGKVGDWKNHFDADMNKRFDEYIARNIGKSTLTYDYE